MHCKIIHSRRGNSINVSNNLFCKMNLRKQNDVQSL
nr:MAG TPA: hypothetical protein [Caudoviricetes sp.]